MEYKCSLDSRDEVRKLQDRVRKLELQNEQLRSQQISRNGLLENKQSILSCPTVEDYLKNRIEISSQSLDDNHLILEELDNEEFLNDETWLKTSGGEASSTTTLNLIQWLRQDVDNHNDSEIQRIRRVLIQKIDDIEQGSRRNIDTRTFTRPKKRISRPTLETMSEGPIIENHSMLSPWQKLLANHITENIDDFSMKLDNTFPSLTDSPNLNTTYHKSNIVGFNSTFRKIGPESRLSLLPDPRCELTFIKPDCENHELNTASHKSSDSDLSSSSRKASDPCLNITFLKSPEAVPTSRSRSITPSGLNCTFSVPDNSYRSIRAQSCDSVADDDQLSSASDSSFSSTTRLMNVGDVQNIARLQEESLKQVTSKTSTPKKSHSKDGISLGHLDDMLSPIKLSSQDLNHGYQSDHSDHSSAEGRVKSARSSVRSSPAGSPFGSTHVLSHDCPPSNIAAGIPRRELKLIPPARKPEVPKSQTVTRLTETGRGRPMSGIRPPVVRTQVISRPSSAGGSNIPRPPSRIPGPRVRSAAYSTQPTSKVDWMDGCY